MRNGWRFETSLKWSDFAEVPRRNLAIASTLAVTVKTNEGKISLRQMIADAGLGERLGNAIGAEVYPKGGKVSIGAAGSIFPRGPGATDILSAFDDGATIKSKDGFFLSVPAPGYAAFVRDNPRLTPGEFERRVGVRLRFVYRPGAASLLVVDNARATKSGFRPATQRQRRAWNSRMLGTMATVPVFFLVPQVSLRKRFDIESRLTRIVEGVPDQIQRELDRLER